MLRPDSDPMIEGITTAHLVLITRTLKKAEEILEIEDYLTDAHIVKLSSMLEQLTIKLDMLKQLNGLELESMTHTTDLETKI